MGRRRNHARGNDAGVECLAIILLCIVAMPLVGLYLVCREDADSQTKAIGGVLLIIGVILWIGFTVVGAK